MSSVGIGGEWKAILPGSAVGAGGEWKDIEGMWVGAGGAWKRFFAGAVVTVSGHTVSSTSSSGNSTATIRFNADGTVDQDENGVTTQVDSATDWIVPNSAASSDYQIRYTNFTGSALLSPPSAEDEWIDLSTDRNFSLFRFSGNLGTSSCTFTIEIREGTGSVLDSATYTLTAEVT